MLENFRGQLAVKDCKGRIWMLFQEGENIRIYGRVKNKRGQSDLTAGGAEKDSS
jgi:hypothetical protein